ncbi:hypothetical protein BDW59DRAFT_144095 [Aspergillus cavernicola]|uniref:Uncharacterized protein n=1 Tax=Aspergillus cavernicola TaxID=176166 RepID=A0ABR4IIM8_9EURO
MSMPRRTKRETRVCNLEMIALKPSRHPSNDGYIITDSTIMNHFALLSLQVDRSSARSGQWHPRPSEGSSPTSRAMTSHLIS